MTPLNCIIFNSNVLLEKAKLACQESKDDDNARNEKKMIEGIQHSAQILQFYNLSIIERMKIQQDDLKQREPVKLENACRLVTDIIQNFKMYILKRELNVTIEIDETVQKEINLVACWDQFKLVLFNVIQNAVKYNKNGGAINVFMFAGPQS